MASLEIRVQGAANLRRVAEQIRSEGRKPLGREMATALSKALEPVKISIAKEADQVMPNRGGYNAVFSSSLRHRTSRRASGNQASVILTTYADGKKDRRDIGSLNQGNLRHPVFGRSRKIRRGNRTGTAQANPWAVTSIRPGFYNRGTDNAMDESEKQVLVVIDDLVRRLAK